VKAYIRFLRYCTRLVGWQ